MDTLHPQLFSALEDPLSKTAPERDQTAVMSITACQSKRPLKARKVAYVEPKDLVAAMKAQPDHKKLVLVDCRDSEKGLFCLFFISKSFRRGFCFCLLRVIPYGDLNSIPLLWSPPRSPARLLYQISVSISRPVTACLYANSSAFAPPRPCRCSAGGP